MHQIRVAGLLYVLLSIAGILGSLVIPNAVIVSGDAPATAAALRSSESLFRVGLAIELIAAIVFFAVACALYRVFRPVDRDLAAAMLLLVVIAVPISFIAVVLRLGALVLVSGDAFLGVFSAEELDSLAYLFLRLHSQAYFIVQVFHGLWLLPLAALAFRSAAVPRVVGALVLVAGLAYVAMTVVNVVIPESASAVSRFTMPLVGGELAIVLWLLFTRARAPLAPQPAPAF